MKLKLSKLEVFIEESWLNNSKFKAALAHRKKSCQSLLDIVCRDREGVNDSWVLQLVARLRETQFHEPFSRSRKHKEPYILRFLRWTASIVKTANLDLEFDASILELQSSISPCTKALHLIELVPATQLVESTVELLRINFAQCQDFYPFFVSGSVGKSSLLANLVCHSGTVSKEQVKFECERGDPDGVYVWPEPVQCGEVTVMLLKLRAGGSDLELKRRVRAGLMMLSSVCCLCEETSSLIRGEMDCFAQDYAAIRAKLELETSTVMVCTQESSFRRESDSASFHRLIETHHPLFTITTRGREDSSDDRRKIRALAGSLANVRLHEPYRRTHAEFFGTNYLRKFTALLHSIMKVANLDVAYKVFLEKLPNPRDTEESISIQLNFLEKQANHSKMIQDHSKAQNFLIEKTENRITFNAFDDKTVEKIQQTYKLTEPTIVLLLMGAQGLGKSTLLNSIVQFCIESPGLTAKFKTGNTNRHTTKESQVLSHPLLLKNFQLMLLDLEGLGGTETTDLNKAVLQANLVSALLTIASVPCILVNNTAESLLFIERTVALIAKLQREFQFITERVFVLAHDKNSDAEDNSDFLSLIWRLNNEHFAGREVM